MSASDGAGARGALRGRGPAARPTGSDEVVEVPLTFDDNRLASLVFGQYDQNVAHIERRLEVTATALGNHLVIKGPAAQISITGRTGLRAKDYDQEVLVVPHIGNSLPVIGAVVGGPIGAAAGLAVQGILGQGLNKIRSVRYHVTGSWDKPVMTLVEKREVPVAPAATTPPLLPGVKSNPAITIPLRESPALPAAASSSGLPL